MYQGLAREHSRREALIQSSRDGLTLIGLDRRIQILNRRAFELLDLPGRPEDWVERSFQAVLYTLRRCAPDVLRAALAEKHRVRRGLASPTEGRYEVAERALHWQSLSVRDGETLLGQLFILRDVSERRLVEKMHEDLTDMLVHDLRNPITTILSATELLQLEGVAFTPDQHVMLRLVRSGSERLLNLVNAILDVNRLESGQMPLDCAPVTPAALVVEALRLQAPLADQKHIHLDNAVPSRLPPIQVDAGLIGRVLQNLIGNAIKFTPVGGDIRVTAETVETSGGPMLMTAVSDTGPGVPAEIGDRLFQKFVTARQPGRGSGLGLAFCRLAVEAHGGHIWLDSKASSETVFKFTLPVAAAAQAGYAGQPDGSG